MFSKPEFPIECIEDIFRHLRDKDLIKCTLVCPEWNEFIGSTRSCMKKITFRLCHYASYQNICVPKRTAETTLINSNRKYERLVVSSIYSLKNHEILSAKGRKWTHVFVYGHPNFATVNHVVNFLRIVQSSIESLNLPFGSIVCKDYGVSGFKSDLQFPSLKVLKVAGDFTLLYDKAFSSCKNLEKLSIWRSELPQSVLDAVRTSIKSSSGLKTLAFHAPLLFTEKFLPEIKLKELAISIFKEDPNYTLYDNLNLFLKTQRETLEILNFTGYMNAGLGTLKIVSSMHRLKEVDLGIVHNIDANVISTIQQCHSVEKFDCLIDSTESTKSILNIFPKVKLLKIYELTDEIADFIPDACIFLKKLHVKRFCAENISNEAFYLNLDELCSDDPICEVLYEKLNGK